MLSGKTMGTGCILDGAFGQRSNEIRLVLLAHEHGFQGDSEELLARYSSPAKLRVQLELLEPNVLAELSDECLDALNRSVVPPDHTLDWREGDLMCLPDSLWDTSCS